MWNASSYWKLKKRFKKVLQTFSNVLTNFLWNTCELFYKVIANFFYEVLTSFSISSYRLFKKFLQTFQEVLTDFSRSSYRLFTKFLQIFYNDLTIFYEVLTHKSYCRYLGKGTLAQNWSVLLR